MKAVCSGEYLDKSYNLFHLIGEAGNKIDGEKRKNEK